MQTTEIEAGNSLHQIAQDFYDDPMRFRDLLDMNPDIDIFDVLTIGSELLIPSVPELAAFKDLDLQTVYDQATDTFKQVEGYAQEALELFSDLNESTPERAIQLYNKIADQFKGVKENFIDWLLKPTNADTRIYQEATDVTDILGDIA